MVRNGPWFIRFQLVILHQLNPSMLCYFMNTNFILLSSVYLGLLRGLFPSDSLINMLYTGFIKQANKQTNKQQRGQMKEPSYEFEFIQVSLFFDKLILANFIQCLR